MNEKREVPIKASLYFNDFERYAEVAVYIKGREVQSIRIPNYLINELLGDSSASDIRGYDVVITARYEPTIASNLNG